MLGQDPGLPSDKRARSMIACPPPHGCEGVTCQVADTEIYPEGILDANTTQTHGVARAGKQVGGGIQRSGAGPIKPNSMRNGVCAWSVKRK